MLRRCIVNNPIETLVQMAGSEPNSCGSPLGVVSNYAPFTTTLIGTIPVGSSSVDIAFEAERDTVFTDLSIRAFNDAGTLKSAFDAEYCNTVYAEDASTDEYKLCCQRKPVFFTQVRENKRLRFSVRTTEPVPNTDARVLITLSGFQGSGCC